MKKLLLSTLAMTTISAHAADEFFEPKSSAGGYGELHYNQKFTDGQDPAPILDFHRFVLFAKHQWTPEWSFNSEIELEHNFVQEGEGELELEQAYVEYLPNPIFAFRAGVILPSIGLINETHEPPMFFGVERPNYASQIIPTTWFGNGMQVAGQLPGGFEYLASIMEGLSTSKESSMHLKGIRDGRQKGYKSSLETILLNARLDYTGMPGLRVGGSYNRNELMMNRSLQQYNSIDLMEVHARYDANNILAAAEFAFTSFDPVGNKTARITEAGGYYVNAGYNVGAFFLESAKLYPFVQWSVYNKAAAYSGQGAETLDSDATEESVWKAGIHFQPIDQVVFKADYGQLKKTSEDKSTGLLNLGVGYHF